MISGTKRNTIASQLNVTGPIIRDSQDTLAPVALVFVARVLPSCSVLANEANEIILLHIEGKILL